MRAALRRLLRDRAARLALAALALLVIGALVGVVLLGNGSTQFGVHWGPTFV